MTTILQTLDTPDGPFSLLALDGAVISSGWTANTDDLLARLHPAERALVTEIEPGATFAGEAVAAFYSGDLGAIGEVPVRQSGGPFRVRAWAALRTIPAGSPLTYSEFAQLLGSPTAVRAAASSCATNAPALFVPCHRVLRTDGSLGGFAWGLPVKGALLAREADASGTTPR